MDRLRCKEKDLKGEAKNMHPLLNVNFVLAQFEQFISIYEMRFSLL